MDSVDVVDKMDGGSRLLEIAWDEFGNKPCLHSSDP